MFDRIKDLQSQISSGTGRSLVGKYLSPATGEYTIEYARVAQLVAQLIRNQ